MDISFLDWEGTNLKLVSCWISVYFESDKFETQVKD